MKYEICFEKIAKGKTLHLKALSCCGTVILQMQYKSIEICLILKNKPEVIIIFISTKGRYALRIMIELAENNTGEYIALKAIAEKQEISLKYLQTIMTVLSKADFVQAQQGKGGGYKLKLEPSQYTVRSILLLTEQSLASVSCLETEKNRCARCIQCKTISMWAEYDKLTSEFFDKYTLADFI